MTTLGRLFIFALLLLVPALCFAQQDPSSVRSSAAYSEILLKKTELLAELDAFSADYTDVHPQILDLRAQLASLDRSIARLFAVKPADAGKLSLALGKLIVRKAELDTELSRLGRTFSKEHPDVKRVQRRIDIFENAIREILK